MTCIMACFPDEGKQVVKCDIQLNNIVFEKWKQDTSGCLGFRKLIIKNNIEILSEFIDENVECLYFFLGKPNFISNSRRQYIYYTGCIYTPKFEENDTTAINEMARYLIFEVDNQDKVYELRELIP
jgi:hypothetical protein